MPKRFDFLFISAQVLNKLQLVSHMIDVMRLNTKLNSSTHFVLYTIYVCTHNGFGDFD